MEFGQITLFKKDIRDSYIMVNIEIPDPNMTFLRPTWKEGKIRSDELADETELINFGFEKTRPVTNLSWTR